MYAATNSNYTSPFCFDALVAINMWICGILISILRAFKEETPQQPYEKVAFEDLEDDMLEHATTALGPLEG